MFLGYNTNGFAHHRLDDAIDIMAELGYGGVALTLDVHHIDPLPFDYDKWMRERVATFGPDVVNDPSHPERLPIAKALGRFDSELVACRGWLEKHRVKCVIETGARFVLDPRRKHQPTLISPNGCDSGKRYMMLYHCLDAAKALGAECVSFWSGTPEADTPPSVLMNRLVEQCKRLADHAGRQNVRLAFEPEPGMFIDTMDKFAELHGRVNHPAFGLTIDIGHLVCNGELPVSKFLRDWQHVLWNVHVEDMRRGVHDHLMFGEGEVDFADVFAGLRDANYTGGVYVELSRHSYDAVNTARRAKAFLDQWM